VESALGENDEINLVNDVVTAIRGSLDPNRRELVKHIMVDAFTFEVARAVDRDLSERIGDFPLDADRQRLVTVLLALTDAARMN